MIIESPQPEDFALEARFLQAISHPVRLCLLHFLADGPRCNCEIVPSLNLDQSTISRHLNTLKRAGILASYKDGVKVMFRIQDGRVLDLMDNVSTIVAESIRMELAKLEAKQGRGK
jgi:ArsR family transcriptional regulator